MEHPAHTFTRILDHAYAAAHGHLAAPTDATQGGHPIGAWLAECRKKDNAQTLPKDQPRSSPTSTGADLLRVPSIQAVGMAWSR
ncbi:helicase associated domain-containing protein [Streptomyces sp. NPDC005784]|uniref:helicase associated domain-containing protein n=1 Tax=Streptomyces sp. NPDC005784 TaxID=3364731 RepID=UPI0036CD7CE4